MLILNDKESISDRLLEERNPKVLQDDYVKFLRLAQFHISKSKAGIVGYITNHGYIDNPTFRGQRQSLASEFGKVAVYDLHGNSRKRETCPDGTADENVFDILQGVAIFVGIRTSAGLYEPKVSHADVWGARAIKYQFLLSHTFSTTPSEPVTLAPPFYVFTQQQTSTKEEFQLASGYHDIFNVISNGFKTHRDHVALDFDHAILEERIRQLRDMRVTDDRLRQVFQIDTQADQRLSDAREILGQVKTWKNYLLPALYRPFDFRSIYYHKAIVDRPRRESMWHMECPNVGLIVGRQGQAVGAGDWDLLYCGQRIADTNLFYRGGIAYAPLYLYSGSESVELNLTGERQTRRPNFKSGFLASVSRALDLPQTGSDSLPQSVTPEEIFHYAYGVFHSPGYRSRYAEFLKIDFPRLPLTGNVELFRALAKLGGDLVALHLLEDDYPAASWNVSKPKGKSPLQHLITKFAGKGDAEVAKGYPKYAGGKVYINPSRWFEGVPENVWHFHIGGYQVCEKWLKDRRGRTLSEEDILHYQRVVVALNETIRLMAEIDQVIEAHGGWPGAFATK